MVKTPDVGVRVITMTSSKEQEIEIEKRRERLVSLLASGITSPTQLAPLLGVARKTVYEDLKALRKNIKALRDEQVDELYFTLEINRKALTKQLWGLISKTDADNIKLGAINSAVRLQAEHIGLLQSLGYIEKAPEKIDIVETRGDIQQVLKRLREIEDKKAEDVSGKSK